MRVCKEGKIKKLEMEIERKIWRKGTGGGGKGWGEIEHKGGKIALPNLSTLPLQDPSSSKN